MAMVPRTLCGVFVRYSGCSGSGGCLGSVGPICWWSPWAVRGCGGLGCGPGPGDAGVKGDRLVGHTGPRMLSVMVVGSASPRGPTVDLGVLLGLESTDFGLENLGNPFSGDGPGGDLGGVEVGAGGLSAVSPAFPGVGPCAPSRRTSQRLALRDSGDILSRAIARKAGLVEGRGTDVVGARAAGHSFRRTVEKSRRCGVRLDDEQASALEAFVGARA